MFSPSAETESIVKTWLKKAGAVDIAVDGSLITFTITVSKANKVLNTKYNLYTRLVCLHRAFA